MKRLLMLTLVLVLVCPLTVYGSEAEGYFEFFSGGDTVNKGEIVRVSLNLTNDVGAFIAKVDYDDTVFQYINTESSDKGYTETYDDGASTSSIFTLKDGMSAVGSGFTWCYRVMEDTSAETSEISVNLSQIADTSGESYLEDQSFNGDFSIAPEPSTEAFLLELSPARGDFDEAFSPDVYEYTMSVPYEVKQMDFSWICSEGASASINRKNLGSGGSVSRFAVTVTAQDNITKAIYTVDVTRGAYVRDNNGGAEVIPPKDEPPKDSGTSSKKDTSSKSSASSKSSSSSRAGTSTKSSTSSKGGTSSKSGAATKSSGSKERLSMAETEYEEELFEDQQKYGEYTENAPLVMNNDSLLPYIAGVGSGIAAIAAGALIAVLIMRGPTYQTKHSSDNKEDGKS